MTLPQPLLNTEKYQFLSDALEQQKKAYLGNPMPSVEYRQNMLDRLHNAILEYKDRLVAAINDDFSNRCESETLLSEILPLFDAIAYNRKRIKKWVKPQRRHAPMMIQPASVRVLYQPLGVIGIVVPWNFPVFLGLSPLVSAFAAGNRAMIKTSEFAPRASVVIKEMIEAYFSKEEVLIVEGGVDVSTEFTRLPFDHLVFTGATEIGKHVMRAAADNLTPVTLELGGKSPVIIHDSFPIAEAAKRIAFGKCMNAGQICVSPDYILCPRDKVNTFVSEFRKRIEAAYPSFRNNKDWTGIINERQLSRLQGVVKDAEEKGASILPINPASETFDGTRKMPLTMVLNVSDDMRIMQEELFGPLLPILPYDDLDEAISYVNNRPRPLALYYFDYDKSRGQHVLETTHSGGVCINDTLSHVMSDDVPFGGIGPSGMGHYHGKEGFLNFSKAKAVVAKGKVYMNDRVGPPWGRLMYRSLMLMLSLKLKKHKL